MSKTELHIESFKSFIHQHQLLDNKDHILVGVSGGMDSMVLLHLLHSCNYKISVAHINYQLRAEDSDKDEQFVQDYCNEKNIPFYKKRHPIDEDAKESLQMQARNLRYTFFENCCKENVINKIALAHHSNDLAETLTLHFIKGPTLFGMKGIPLQHGKVVRPLLAFDQNQIRNFCELEKIEYRTDQSNSSIKYQRNLIRHELIPLIERINPSFHSTLIEHRNNLVDDQELIIEYISQIRSSYCKQTNDDYIISKECLQNTSSPSSLLYYLLHPYNFSRKVCNQIAASIHTSGASFISGDFTLQVIKKDLIISQSSKKKEISILIQNDLQLMAFDDIELTFDLKTDVDINYSNSVIQLDYNDLLFPLILRNWKNGDSFQPLGLNGQSKKISDLLNDRKLTLHEKQKTLVLSDANDIILAVLGIAQADTNKLTESTSNVFQMNIKKAALTSKAAFKV